MPADQTKILVVDDNPGTRYSTSRVLRAAGFHVVEAATGADGVSLAPNVDLVVLDINLPDIDGFEVCRRIRASQTTIRTPVIHLSASFVQENDKVRGLDFGADGYLTHPVEAPVLLATVNAFLRARQAEASMRESEAKFRAIFEQTPHGISLVSEDFVYLEVNPAMCKVLGRTRDQIVGKHNSAFLPRGHEKDVITITDELARLGSWSGTAVLVRPDASQVELEWSISPFSMAGVKLAMATDVTQRRRTEMERDNLLASERAARSEAERANRLKDDFLATLSHELRTPLNAIVGWTQILRQGTPTPEELAEGIESIDRNVRVQAQLISDLLDVSRITTGKMRLELQSIDSDTLVNAALNAVLPAATAKSITVRRHLGTGEKIVVDPNRLQQIIWNLMTNAVKFTPPGGAIDVYVTFTEAAMTLIVKDSGQGITPEFLPHLFDRFSQADPSAKRFHGGLGIGLAIVKNLVEMHGGTVQASSKGAGHGAQFSVVLPRAGIPVTAVPSPPHTAPLNEPEIPPPQTTMSLRGVRVLVVDDDADARKVLKRTLEDYDAIVQDAENVPLALRAVESFKPHILISDIGMPGQDGYDLVRQMRRREDSLCRIPAIALTAFAGAESADRSLREGFQTHLTKPINPGRIVIEIEKLLGKNFTEQP